MNRRDVLKGMTLSAGSVLLGPILEKLQAQAAGRAQTPKRFVFVVESNGVRPEQMPDTRVSRRVVRFHSRRSPPGS